MLASITRTSVSNGLILSGLLVASISIILFGIALTNLGMAILLLGCLLSPATYRWASWNAVPVPLWIGLVLFVWMTFSIAWSVGTDGNISEGVRKYREFLLLPLMWIGVRQLTQIRWAIEAMYVALLVSVLASFALWLDWIDVPGAHLSLKNRIFFGVSTSIFLYWSLLRLSEGGLMRVYAALSAGLALFALLFIETGRTGYVMTVALLGWYLWLQFPDWKARGAAVAVATVALFSAYQFDDGLNQRVNQSVSNTVAYFESGKGSSIGYRLEFYRNALVGWQDEPVFGHGVGSYPTAVQEFGNPDRPWGVGHNPHQQYLLFLFEGGAVAGLLFIGFLSLLFITGLRSKDRYLQGLTIGIAISCLFNSSFLDSNDSHFYWLMLLFFLVGAVKPVKQRSKSGRDQGAYL